VVASLAEEAPRHCVVAVDDGLDGADLWPRVHQHLLAQPQRLGAHSLPPRLVGNHDVDLHSGRLVGVAVVPHGRDLSAIGLEDPEETVLGGQD